MRFIKNIRALRKDLLALFIFSIINILIIDFWLINIPEIFIGGAKIGNIIYELCFSYISAFIFYFLVIHLKYQRDKENIYSYISKYTFRIIFLAKILAKNLAENSGIQLKGNYPSKKELIRIYNEIDPSVKGPSKNGLDKYDNYLSCLSALKNNQLTIIKDFEKILSMLSYLDSELVNKLLQINECDHISGLFFNNNPLSVDNYKLIYFEFSISKYFDLIKDLEKYYENKLKSY